MPARDQYPFRWFWDSAMISLGWAQIDERRAWVELEASMSSQWPSGMVPHIDFGSHNHTGGYFPGPEVWATRHGGSGVTQPPLAAITALEIFTKAKDRELARAAMRALYPKLIALHRWLYRVRRVGDTGQLVCLHPWETGMDNSPAWDRPLSVLDTSRLPSYVRRDIAHVEISKRPQQSFYDHSYALLLRLRELGYDTSAATTHSPFAVADICFNALAVRASADLLALGCELGEDTAEVSEWLELGKAGLESLWNPSLGIFTSYDWRANEPLKIATCGGFLPLLTSVPSKDQVQRLADLLERWSGKVHYLLPSLDPYSELFDPMCYWRGPVWANMNWAIATGFAQHGRPDLADRLRDHTAQLVGMSGCWEYFEPDSGQGLGAKNFSWTAALALSWL